MFEVLFDIFAPNFRLKIDCESMGLVRETDGKTRSETLRADTSPKIDAAFVRAVKTADFSVIRSTYADALKSLEVSLASTPGRANRCRCPALSVGRVRAL